MSVIVQDPTTKKWYHGTPGSPAVKKFEQHHGVKSVEVAPVETYKPERK